VVVATRGRGWEEEAGGTDLRRWQRWERQAEERRLCEVGFHQVDFYPRCDWDGRCKSIRPVMNDQKKSGFIRKMALFRFHDPFTVFFLLFLL
jgi:hypothetical protein